MILTLFNMIILFFIATLILIPVYIRVFKDTLFKEWEEKLEKNKQHEKLKKSIENGKKENNERQQR